MYYTQLRAFHAVAKAGGFSSGAQSLGLTQPAVSDQVRKLEDAFGVVLFNRGKRKISITATGAHLLNITNRLFQVESEAVSYLAEAEALQSGALKIMTDSAFHVTQILRRFRDTYPGITLSIGIGNSEKVAARLLSYEADIGVFADTLDDPRFLAIKLGTDRLVAFVESGHRLAKQTTITLAELAGETLVLRERGSVTRRLIEQAFADSTLVPVRPIEVEGREAAREVVAAGIGVGIVSKPEFGYDGRLHLIEISDSDQAMDETIVCLAARSEQRLIRAFLDCAQTEISQQNT